VTRMQFMQDIAVDLDEFAAIGALRDAMKIPDLIE